MGEMDGDTTNFITHMYPLAFLLRDTRNITKIKYHVIFELHQ